MQEQGNLLCKGAALDFEVTVPWPQGSSGQEGVGAEMPERRVGLPAHDGAQLGDQIREGVGGDRPRAATVGAELVLQHIYSFLLSLEFTACRDPGGALASGGIQGRELDRC